MPPSGGKLLVRLPPELHLELKSAAAQNNKTLNEFCLESLRQKLDSSASAPLAINAQLSEIINSTLSRCLEAVVLFGSVARDEAWNDSDTDLLLCLPRGAELRRDLYHQWDDLVERSAGRIPSTTSAHFAVLPDDVQQAGGLWFEVSTDGIVLWDPRLTVSRFLGRVRRHLMEGGAVRKTTYGVPYWVRTDAKSKAG